MAAGCFVLVIVWIWIPHDAADAHTGCPAAAINGTPNPDMLFGDANNDPSHDHADTITGHGGGDYIEGYSCGDTLSGGDGQDEIHGGFGPDNITGGPAKDTDLVGQGIFLGNGNDTADGEAADDGVFSSSNSADSDTLKGGSDVDRVSGLDTDTNDSVQGNGGGSALNPDVCWIDTTGGGPPQDNIGPGCESVVPG
jgi:Ca2+-binding RTX toxin-like protein